MMCSLSAASVNPCCKHQYPCSKYCLFAPYWLFWLVLLVCWLTHWRQPKRLRSHFFFSFFYLFCWMSRCWLPFFFVVFLPWRITGSCREVVREQVKMKDSRRWEVTKAKYVVDVLDAVSFSDIWTWHDCTLGSLFCVQCRETFSCRQWPCFLVQGVCSH